MLSGSAYTFPIGVIQQDSTPDISSIAK